MCLTPDGSLSGVSQTAERERQSALVDKANVFYFSWGQEVTVTVET